MKTLIRVLLPLTFLLFSVAAAERRHWIGTNGPLTGPSSAPLAEIGIDFLKTNRRELKLNVSELDSVYLFKHTAVQIS